jgi:hypothetical protein
MSSLLLVESFDFRPSNQYILVRVIPSCFRFAKMCLCQVSLLSRGSPRYFISSSWGSCILFIWTRGWVRFSSCSECYVDRLGFIGFHRRTGADGLPSNCLASHHTICQMYLHLYSLQIKVGMKNTALICLKHLLKIVVSRTDDTWTHHKITRSLLCVCSCCRVVKG